jgi:hypothetical protein
MRYRRNADVDLRELERRAAAGDLDARRRLIHHMIRIGTLTVQWLAHAGPNAVWELPEELRTQLKQTVGLAFLIDRYHVHEDGSESGGWFPDHKRWDECPRGHRLHDKGISWTYSDMVPTYRDVDDSHEDGLFVAGLSRGGDYEIADLVTCNRCEASWPAKVLDWV